MRPQRFEFLLGVLLFPALSGCARPTCPAQEPDRVLRDYAEALRTGDAERAWALLSEETKRTTTFEVFKAELVRDPTRTKELAETLERPVGPPILTAELGSPDVEPIEMVWIDGRWRLRLASLDPYSQATPKAALRSFARAIKQRRYDVLLRLAPSTDRKQLDIDKLRRAFEGPQRQEVMALSQAIEVGLAEGRLEVTGDRATFDVGAGSTVELLLEGGNWCIENYRP